MQLTNSFVHKKINEINQSGIYFVLPFAAFVLWLLAFPMDGFLLAGKGGKHSLEWFLIPHTLALLLTGHFVTGERMSALLSMVGIGLTITLTASFPVVSINVHTLMAIIGVSAAPLTLKACAILKRCGNPAVAAAIGLAAGNALLYLMIYLPLLNEFKLLIIALGLFLPLLAPSVAPVGRAVKGLVTYLPFIFVFQLLCGMMYGYLMKAYAEHSFLTGSELIFYIAAVLCGVRMTGNKKERLLAAGVLFGMFSFSFLHGKTGLMINMSMYTMQGAAGFMDLFLICLMLSCEGTYRALGYGFGTTCLGILCGKFVSYYAGKYLPLYMSVGNIILSLSVLLLYFRSRNKDFARESEDCPIHAVPAGASPAVGMIPGSAGQFIDLPPGLNKRFSDKEKRVLELVLQGKTFKETAGALEISVSSVKTYMKRIYEKTGVACKDDLVDFIAGSGISADKSNDNVIPFKSVN